MVGDEYDGATRQLVGAGDLDAPEEDPGEHAGQAAHGALHLTSIFKLPLATIALIFVLKAIASVISLGSGFRGGLFFASLLLGALGGQLFAFGLGAAWPGLHIDPDSYAVIGMCALSVSVIGGPLTMTFIALETTGDLWLTTAVLIAAIIAMRANQLE